MIEETVRMVPGIVATHMSVSWSVDDRQLKSAEDYPFFPYGGR
jgi:hypothetical protein